MDRQDAKPRRPSLLAGAPEHAAATPSSARILADMDGRKPAPRDVTQTAGGRWLWLPVAVMVVIAAGWFWQGDLLRSGPGATRGTARQPVDQPSRHAAGSASVTSPEQRQAATIIDDAVDPSGDGRETAASQVERGGTSRGGPLVADPSPFAAMTAANESRRSTTPNADNPFTALPPTRPATSRNRPPSAPPATRPVGDQTDLLATLLRNIQTHAEPQPSGLDSLIEKMDSADKGGAPPRSIHAEGASGRSQQIQANLRECPAANSAKGLKCRQEICAVYAGRDPACPAM